MQKVGMLALASLLIAATARAQISEIVGNPIRSCAEVMRKWHHDSSPFVEINLAITNATCGFTLAAKGFLKPTQHYTGQGYLLPNGELVLPLKKEGQDVGHFRLKQRARALGGRVTYETTYNIELWPAD